MHSQVAEGWLHWVFNTHPCVKVAMEVLRPQAAAACMQMQRLLRSNFDQGQEAYMRVSCRVWEALLAWHRWCHRQMGHQLQLQLPE